MGNRPILTLFMLQSIDGKISTGDGDNFDFDKDLPLINGLREGLDQYYQIEQTTDLWSLCTGKTQAKIGINEWNIESIQKTDVNFIIIDNNHLTINGIKNLMKKAKELVLVTTNNKHPAIKMASSDNNLSCIAYEKLNLDNLLETLYNKYNCKSITLQSGGTMNGFFLRQGLIDRIKVVIAPVLIGGKNVPTLVDGTSPMSIQEIQQHGVYELYNMHQLNNSYIELDYIRNK